jgi:Arginyl tRNA synthetase N terminal domain
VLEEKGRRRVTDAVATRNLVEAAVSAAMARVLPAELAGADPLVRRSEHADFQSNVALALAKPSGRKPLDLAPPTWRPPSTMPPLTRPPHRMPPSTMPPSTMPPHRMLSPYQRPFPALGFSTCGSVTR